MAIHSPFRNLVVGVDRKLPLVNGKYVTGINFDNAATTPPLHSVMEELGDFAPWYSSIHRGAGYKSILSSDVYEEGRDVIKKFVNADHTRDVVIYTKNTTEAINLLSYILEQKDDKQVILSTDMEHLANDLPWRDKFLVDYVSIDEFGKLSLEDLEMKLIHYGGRIKLVTVTGASNVTGYKNPIYKIAKLAHKYEAKILVDGAQLAPHCPIDMKDYESLEHLDYLVFSAHKMYAPFGIGVLIGPKETFEGEEPYCKGGGAVKLVSHQFIAWDTPPHKEEAGTPNVMGVVALLAAIKTLSSIGMQVIDNYEQNLIHYAIAGLTSIPDIKLYCCAGNKEDRLGIIAFDLPGIHHELLANILSHEAGIAVRNGLFCAHPYIEKLLGITNQKLSDIQKNPNVPCPGLVRMSLGLYNNSDEVDILIDLLHQISKNKKAYIQKY
ncbi:aminotransferase class V-fold PLP-dependent enzyme [Pelosinus sp. IPA-1]|uniref:aminotransferase class V-fold PLP-dependent enzyme n=1 Tax=Pelosinus sp. IPA-1 TaxID=3029569 RepID=UPI002436291D|nr:aminotransferase class V-fold PLP-dependent enzyme [Pelosinus sp. IPA-1]GMA97384.1 class V aminotransferase [Pelosinus sp. IPA-1]